MNPDTLVAVSCYSGDQPRVEAALDLYLHHECPVFVLSPEDAPATIEHPWVTNRHAGKNCYDGQACLDRYDDYLRIMLATPYQHFMFCDSDAFCLTPDLPRRWYGAPDVFWSFVHPEGRPHVSPYPKIAFQPPLFFNRSTLEAMLKVDRARVRCHPITPYPDWFWVALVCEAGLGYAHNPEAISYMCWNGGPEFPASGFDLDASYKGGDHMISDILSGRTLIHSVRHRHWLQKALESRQEYVRRHP